MVEDSGVVSKGNSGENRIIGIADRLLRQQTVRSTSSIKADPKLWNAPPLDIRESTNFETFNRKLKSHMFTRAYSVA